MIINQYTFVLYYSSSIFHRHAKDDSSDIYHGIWGISSISNNKLTRSWYWLRKVISFLTFVIFGLEWMIDKW